jgi:hypothetical protein
METEELASYPNVASVASTSQGSGTPQEPQWGDPRLAGRILFFFPHAWHTSVETGPAEAALAAVGSGAVIGL